MSAIAKVQGLPPAAGISRPGGVEPRGSGFSNLIGDAVKQLDAIQRQADSAAVQVAGGENVELHSALVTMEEASLALQLTLQVRNKIVEGYQEVMRMQV